MMETVSSLFSLLNASPGVTFLDSVILYNLKDGNDV